MSRERQLKSTARYRRTKKGVVTNIYNKLKSRNSVDFTPKFLHDFSCCTKFDRLFHEWERSNYQKMFKPSIDRISNKKAYLKTNIQWLSWSENRYKQTMERRSRKGPVQQISGDKVIATFRSQREAVLKTGISQGNMSTVLNGKRPSCGGYRFAYQNSCNSNIDIKWLLRQNHIDVIHHRCKMEKEKIDLYTEWCQFARIKL